jgi:CYTH domain-containing protein
VEIERKFLVTNDAWRLSAVGSVSIRDGLIASYEGRKVRVRIAGDTATLAVKGPRTGITRPEFEYEIPGLNQTEIGLVLHLETAAGAAAFEVGIAHLAWHRRASFKSVGLIPV